MKLGRAATYACIFVMALIVVMFGVRWVRVSFTRDAVHVIAINVGSLLERNRAATQEEIQRVIGDLHHASVINLRLDENGQAVDPFGTAFRVEYESNSSGATIGVTSAGPDGTFDTVDDIDFTHYRNYESKPIHPN